MAPVADDFATIARRLKEVQVESAKEREAMEARHPPIRDPGPPAQNERDRPTA